MADSIDHQAPLDAAATARAAADDTAPRRTTYVQVERGMLSRVLYPNPVCLLSVWDAAQHVGNVMTITWLTPINNQGGFICSVNCTRHTAKFIHTPGDLFVLNVPVRGMEDLVLAIGGCSGASVDKFATLEIATCAPDGSATALLAPAPHQAAVDAEVDAETRTSSAPARAKKPKLSRQELARQAIANAAAKCIAVQGCAAHVLCRVESAQTDDGHWTLRCSQLAAWCQADYWDGKNFIPKTPTAAPFLTFLGSKVFAYVTPARPASDA